MLFQNIKLVKLAQFKIKFNAAKLSSTLICQHSRASVVSLLYWIWDDYFYYYTYLTLGAELGILSRMTISWVPLVTVHPPIVSLQMSKVSETGTKKYFKVSLIEPEVTFSSTKNKWHHWSFTVINKFYLV